MPEFLKNLHHFAPLLSKEEKKVREQHRGCLFFITFHSRNANLFIMLKGKRKEI